MDSHVGQPPIGTCRVQPKHVRYQYLPPPRPQGPTQYLISVLGE